MNLPDIKTLKNVDLNIDVVTCNVQVTSCTYTDEQGDTNKYTFFSNYCLHNRAIQGLSCNPISYYNADFDLLTKDLVQVELLVAGAAKKSVLSQIQEVIAGLREAHYHSKIDVTWEECYEFQDACRKIDTILEKYNL